RPYFFLNDSAPSVLYTLSLHDALPIYTTESVLYDAVYIPGGQASIDALLKKAKFQKFINEALKHCKAIAADKEGEKLLDKTFARSEEHTSELQSRENLVCRLLLEKKKQ